ncbi:MAG: tRNA pseudouridine(38-40) synthase TruA [Planctomycetaceae bacterium]|nr:tRNA pseudouridine(38-40) synthase TruA [Planctomycetaceae bacterium]
MMPGARGQDGATRRTIRLTIAYQGTRYAGWQWQPDQQSVQGVLERAVRELTGETVRVHGAGRTDARVHALGQVAHFQTDSTIPGVRFADALNSVLPRDIVICESREAPDHFHARYSATRKQYRYLIDVSSRRLPWLQDLVWHLPGSFDVAAMHAAGQCLIGRHDFSSFESKSQPDEDSVRTVFHFSVEQRTQAGPWTNNSELVAIDIAADGFLYHMVRSIVGTLVKVAHGRWKADDVRRVLHCRDRSQAGPTAPPQGLYLVCVNYDEPAHDTVRPVDQEAAE